MVKLDFQALGNRVYTLSKFNMEPENDGFQKESTIPGCHFQVNHVKLWEGICYSPMNPHFQVASLLTMDRELLVAVTSTLGDKGSRRCVFTTWATEKKPLVVSGI